VEAIELFPDVLVPVISASVYRTHADERPQDLLSRLPLIHTSTRRHGWSDWLRAQELPVLSGQTAAEFGHFFMGLEEARAGRGIALVPNVVLPDLEYRRKLKVLDNWPGIPSAGEYYLLSKKSHANNAAVSAFVAWVIAEAAKHRKRMRPLAEI
jgi:LysR family glycine cleavage system transcriptional activator